MPSKLDSTEKLFVMMVHLRIFSILRIREFVDEFSYAV